MNAAPLGFLLALTFSSPVLPPEVHPSDLNRFPPACVVDAWMPLISQHRAWLDLQVPLHVWDRDEWAWRPRDMLWRWDVWDDLRIAHSCHDDAGKVIWLRSLRGKIGMEAYYSANPMPAPIPFFMYGRID